jgi:hypothetical protein
MLVFKKCFYKNKKSKLYFGDRVAVLNDFICPTGESNSSTSSSGRAFLKYKCTCKKNVCQ